MERLCARLSCGHQAAASVQFDADGARVVIVDLGDNNRGIPLCGHHTRTRTPPMGWTLVDERTGPVQPSLWNPAAPPPDQLGPTDRPALRRPSEAAFNFRPVADPEAVAVADSEAVAVADPDGGADDSSQAEAEPAGPEEFESVAQDRPAGPSTPLLLRAFRNA